MLDTEEYFSSDLVHYCITSPNRDRIYTSQMAMVKMLSVTGKAGKMAAMIDL